MKATTRVKISLKKHLPSWVFSLIRFVADRSVLIIPPLIFKLRTLRFKTRTVKKVHYGHRSFSIVIDPKNGFHDAQVYAYPLYEPHIVKTFTEHISQGDVCLDIGANIGHHAIIMAQTTGPSGKVYAYEPIPRIRAQMEESLSINQLDNVVVVAEGLSNASGSMKLYLNEGNIAGSSLVNKSEEEIDITLRTLDSYNYEKVDFMKIDVEGYEYNVLAGGEQTIARHHPKILFEFSPTYYQKNNPEHTLGILSFFTKHQYQLIDLEDNNKKIEDIGIFAKEFEEGFRSQTNILAY